MSDHVLFGDTVVLSGLHYSTMKGTCVRTAIDVSFALGQETSKISKTSRTHEIREFAKSLSATEHIWHTTVLCSVTARAQGSEALQ